MSKKLPILYSRRSDGGVQTWEIEIEKNRYRTTIGKEDTEKPNTSEWTEVKSKNTGRANETSANEQALKEAQAKWKKKVKEGYFENKDEIDQVKFFQPMLATKFADREKKITFPCYIQRKMNGGRLCVIKNEPFTRTGETYKTIPHITKALTSLFKKYPSLVLDGEAYNHTLGSKLNQLMSIIRTQVDITEEDIKLSEKIVKYYVYDGFGFDDVLEETLFIDRSNGLKTILQDIPYIYIVPTYKVDNMEELQQKYREFLEEGYEGAIIRLNGPYERKRSKYLIKIKPCMDAECEIIDIQEGSGNWAGTGKVITMKWDGKVFDGTFKGTYEQGVEFLKNKKKWIGKTVTFLYNDLTGKGIPNFARVDIDNCLQGKK